MAKRKKNILIGSAALAVGCVLYVLFRPNTYIGEMFGRWGCMDTVRQICSFYASDLSKFYLPDFLWAFSLGCGLTAIYDPGRKGVVVCASVAFLCGSVWELMQYLDVLSGTGDIHDVIMYFLASTLCIIINLKEKKK